MPLVAGTRVGAYQIVAAISAGGMGAVYRATDTRLNRDVAIKTLPRALSREPERLARFEREGQLPAKRQRASPNQFPDERHLPRTDPSNPGEGRHVSAHDAFNGSKVIEQSTCESGTNTWKCLE